MTLGRSPLRWISRWVVTTAVVTSLEATHGEDALSDHNGPVGSSLRGLSSPISPRPRSERADQSLLRVLEELEPTVHHHIYGGKYVRSWKDYPWMVSLLQRKHHWCGGALIASDYVITAGHCRDGFDSGFTKGRLGSLDKTHGPSYNSNVVSFPVRYRQISRPLNYDAELYHNDIMLIKLDVPLDTTVYTPIDIAPKDYVPQDGQRLTTMGWGETEYGTTPNHLLEVDVNYVPQEACLAAYNDDFIKDDMMCAIAAGRDACQGDSGSPLIIPGSPPTLVGIVSWGPSCASPIYPGVYSRLSENYDWIKDVLCKNSVEPPSWAGCTPNPAPAPLNVQASPTVQVPLPLQASPTIQAQTTGIHIKPLAVKIQIMFDRYPVEIGWWVGCDGTIVRSVPHGSYSDSLGLSEVNETVIIPEGTQDSCAVAIYDQWRDGLCHPQCEGHYAKVILQMEDGSEEELLEVFGKSFQEKFVEFPARRS